MRHMLKALFVAGVLVANGNAAAVRYDRLYAFGDSYSDTGAGYLMSNGPTAVAQLARRLQVPFTHAHDPRANDQGINFAVAGAGTGEDAGRQIGDYWLVVGMQNQVDDFVARVRRGEIRFNPDTTLFFIEGGLNDADGPAQTTTGHLTHQIEQLKSVGARHVSLALLPTRIPAFRNEGRKLNPAFRRLVPALRTKLAIDVRLNRFGEYLDEVYAHPARYGIANTQSRCASSALANESTVPCATPGAYFYYHEDHPSAAVHRIVGDRLFADITGSRVRR